MNRFYSREAYNRQTEDITVGDSITIKVGDLMRIESATAAVVNAVTEDVYGMVVSVIDAEGIPLEALNADKSFAGSGASWTASTKTFVAGSDNTTTDKVAVRVIPVEYKDEIVMTLDADKGTTTGSNVDYYTIDILTSDASKLDESTAHVTNGLFRIVDANADTLTDTEIVVSPMSVQR